MTPLINIKCQIIWNEVFNTTPRLCKYLVINLLILGHYLFLFFKHTFDILFDYTGRKKEIIDRWFFDKSIDLNIEIPDSYFGSTPVKSFTKPAKGIPEP